MEIGGYIIRLGYYICLVFLRIISINLGYITYCVGYHIIFLMTYDHQKKKNLFMKYVSVLS